MLFGACLAHKNSLDDWRIFALKKTKKKYDRFAGLASQLPIDGFLLGGSLIVCVGCM